LARGWYTLIHLPSETTVARVNCADTWLRRGIGVLGLSGLPDSEGIWLPEVASIHTCGVRFPLDVCFFDGALRGVRLAPDVPPWRPLVRASGARHVVELAAGAVARSGVVWRNGDPWELRAISGT
jgi:uncharacterized membrane protein (UPF0127 family)